MPYIALYRKYRSQTFEDVMGQEHVTRTLQNAIQRGTIGQAYLFTGSRGTGKTTVARLLAKAVNCQDGPTPSPCNRCAMCVAITQGTAVDVAEVDAASNRGVAEMESICESVRYRPMEGRYRVVILDEAHQLSDHAKDAFLKTLEEPPPHAIFVLATTEPSKIPITIRSRCQQFDFHRGTPRQVEERLRWVCQQEGVEIEEGAAALIAAHAQGSWRDGLSLLEQVIAFAGERVTAEDARKVLGALPADLTGRLLDALLSGDAAAVLDQMRSCWDGGADPSRLLSALVEEARSRMESALAANNPADGALAGRLLKLVYHLSEAEAGLRHWERADLAIEVALLSAIQSPSQPVAGSLAPAEATAVAPPRPEVMAATAPVSQTAPVTGLPSTDGEPSAPPAAVTGAARPDVPPDLALFRQAWPQVIQALRADRANTSLCAILKDGRVGAVDDGVIIIEFDGDRTFHVSRTEAVESRIKIEAAFEKVTGASVRVRARLAQAAQTATQKIAPQEPAAAPEAAEPKSGKTGGVMPLVEEVIRTFGGEVLDEKDPFAGD
ncbi:MAG: DNA polymerase III subunit gamma/tau [Armatimonadota bacterium]